MQVGSADKSLAGANQRPLLKSVGPELQRLKERDNYTNYRYIAANYAVFIATILVTLWSYHYAESSRLGGWMTVPISILAVTIIGGFQHQLVGCIHEATHYILFDERKKMRSFQTGWQRSRSTHPLTPSGCIIWRTISSSTIPCVIPTLPKPTPQATGSTSP